MAADADMTLYTVFDTTHPKSRWGKGQNIFLPLFGRSRGRYSINIRASAGR